MIYFLIDMFDLTKLVSKHFKTKFERNLVRIKSLPRRYERNLESHHSMIKHIIHATQAFLIGFKMSFDY